MMATADVKDSSSVSGSVAQDEDDTESTIRWLSELCDELVSDRRRSTTGTEGLKQLSKSLEFIVKPKESSGTHAAQELTKWLQNLWNERHLSDGITDLRLDMREERTTRASAGIHAVPEGETKDSKLSYGHLSGELPQQVCKRLLLTRKKHEDGVLISEVVVVGIRPYIDHMTGLVLEAWGSVQLLELLRDLIEDESKTKPWLDAVCTTHYLVENAFVIVFKKCDSASSRIMLVDYSGPCQPFHDKFRRQLPRVRFPEVESSFGREKFVDRSLQQLHVINSNYKEHLHGKMKAVISYGTFYFANCCRQEVLESEFDGLLQGSRREHTSTPDQALPHGHYCRASFIPTGNPDIDSSRLQNFLQEKGFVLVNEKAEYRITMQLNVCSYQTTKSDVTMALDEDFNLLYINTADIKWLYVDVVSAEKDASYRPYDSRFKILSCTKLTDFQSEIYSDYFASVVANHRAILLRNADNEVYRVQPDLRPLIRSHVRKKDTKVYRLASNGHDAFLNGMAIKVNYGTEYSRPSRTGEFENIDRNRVEVTAIPALPDLRDEDKMKTFFTRCWKFARELGHVLQ